MITKFYKIYFFTEIIMWINCVIFFGPRPFKFSVRSNNIRERDLNKAIHLLIFYNVRAANGRCIPRELVVHLFFLFFFLFSFFVTKRTRRRETTSNHAARLRYHRSLPTIAECTLPCKDLRVTRERIAACMYVLASCGQAEKTKRCRAYRPIYMQNIRACKHVLSYSTHLLTSWLV